MMDSVLEFIEGRSKLVSAIRNLSKERDETDSRTIKYLELSILLKFLTSKLNTVFDLKDLIKTVSSDFNSLNTDERIGIQKDVDLLQFLKSEECLDTLLDSVTLSKEDQWDENP